MRKPINFWICTLICLFSIFTQEQCSAQGNQLAPIHSDSGNFCVDQVHRYIIYRFGTNVKILKTFGTSSGDGGEASVWVHTNICSGYFVGGHNKNASCSISHYGKIPIYINRVWGYGDCARLLYQNEEPITSDMIYPK